MDVLQLRILSSFFINYFAVKFLEKCVKLVGKIDI